MAIKVEDFQGLIPHIENKGTTVNSIEEAFKNKSMPTENNEIFKGTLDALNNLYPEVVEMKIKNWRNTDKYPCPKCGTQLGMPSYLCEKCNVKLKLKMQF